MKWTNKGHEFDDIGYLLKDKKQVFIYGAGDIGLEIFDLLKALNKWIKWDIYLVDRDEHKQQIGYKGNRILSPNQFFDINNNSNKDDYFVVIAAMSNGYREIYNNLVNNLGEDVTNFEGSYFLHRYLSIYFIYRYNMVFFESENMLISSVCNLNCRDCLNFNPYIKNHYNPTLEQLKQNIDTFFNAVDLIYRFQITGGEPLLSKNLIPVLKYINDNYSDRIVRLELVTNGTVMPSDELCEFLSENNVYLYLDDYRCSVPEKTERYYAVYGKLKKFKVKFHDNYFEKWIRMYIPNENIPNMNKDELKNKFELCNNPWCSLKNGKISSCNYAMYADTADICKSEACEYYDLNKYNKDSQRELIEFRLGYSEKGYTEFCKQCYTWTDTNTNWCEPAIQMPKEKINEMDK